MSNGFINRQGSSTVFLAVIMACIISISLALVHAARDQAEKSFADGVFTLSSDSLLGQYDYYVYRDYGLFLLGGTDSRLSDKFNRYAGYSLDGGGFGRKGSISYSNAAVNAGRYSTADTEPVRQQILDYMKSGKAIASGIRGGSNAPARTLRHGPTISSLPSRAMPDSSIIAKAEKLSENLKNPDSLFREGTSEYLIDSYILNTFSNESDPAGAESSSGAGSSHFFRNEVEYIICGKLSDKENLKQTDLAIMGIRTGLNLSHIYSDPEKVAAVEAASQVITPGLLGTVTQAGIAAAWAAAEASNDVKLLHGGYRVPLVKTGASWALDMDALLGGYDENSRCIKPSVNSGRNYEDYLRVLLCIKDDNISVARILDLIQINMRMNHDSDFLIAMHSTGISVDAEVNGKDLSYDRIY